MIMIRSYRCPDIVSRHNMGRLSLISVPMKPQMTVTSGRLYDSIDEVLLQRRW